MQSFLVRRWFLVALVAVLAVGFWLHRPLASAAAGAPRDLIVSVVLFLMALPLETGVIWRALRRPGPALLGVAINFGFLPPLAWLVSPLLPGELGLGLIIIACIPSTLASAAVWTRRAGGNDAIPVLITMITTLSCFLVTPAWLNLLTSTELQLDFQPLVSRLAVLVVLPILIAQILRLWRPLGAWATSQKIMLGVLTQVGVLIMILLGTIQSGQELAGNIDGRVEGLLVWVWMVGLVIAMHLAALWLGHGLARLLKMSREDRIGVGFGGSQKTLMVGLDIGLEYFSGLTILPMVVYHVSQLVVDTVIADRLRNQNPPKSDSEDEPLGVGG